MGEVYRARDTRLGRDVALKVLPHSFTDDPVRRGRLEREARLLATLNHPNIAAIYGVEDADDRLALVLELVPGQTLADHLFAGPLPFEQAMRIARQVAEALDAAHAKRIIHRDLKPANIKIAPDGGVKLLDFGIAKALAGDDASEFADAATATSSTALGSIVGTAAYMSPEQARGQAVDRRADVWAFGCVLFEMLTGRVVFRAATLTDTLVAVLEREPDWTALPASTPALVRRLLFRCLAKDPKNRLRDIGDALIDLTPQPTDEVAMIGVPRVAARPRWPLIAGAAGVVIATALLTHAIWPSSPAPSTFLPDVVRFTIAPPPGWRFGSFVPDVETTHLALSPDGSQLAFVAIEAGGTSAVWLRKLESLESQRLAGTDGAISVFWSPDGRNLGFFAQDKLKRLELPNGAPIAIADVPTQIGVSGSWGDDRILFDAIQANEISSVPVIGGVPVSAIKVDSSREEARLHWPRFLPDGRRALYLTRLRDGEGDLRLLEATGETRSIMRVASNVEYVEPGYLLFVRDSTLLGQRFDARTGTLAAEPFAIADPVEYSFYPPRAAFSASRNGTTVVYQSQRNVSTLVWFDRTGKQIGTVGTPGHIVFMRMSREGREVALALRDPRMGTQDVWSLDLTRGTTAHVTFDPRPESPNAWLPAGRGMLFNAARTGPPQLHYRDLATGEDRPLLPVGDFQIGFDVTPDGRTIIVGRRDRRGGWDVQTLGIDPGATPQPLIASPSFSELDARLSPDGRLLAFVSDESKRFNVYLTTFPPKGRAVQVSTNGGSQPRWSRDGGELHFVSSGQLMAVPIRPGSPVAAGEPRALFPLRAESWMDFDVGPDGKFLAQIADVVGRDQPVTVIVNWPAAVGR